MKSGTIEFSNEIVMFDGIELSVSGSAFHIDGFVNRFEFTKIIETGRPNDSTIWIHLSDNPAFRNVIEKKIDRLLPRYS